MGCCGSSENADSIKKDKLQFENGNNNNVTKELKQQSYSATSRNRVQPSQEDTSTVADSKLSQ